MHHCAIGRRQAGASAIEFAIVFPLFFALLYGILMYGFIFLAQMGLQHAAEDGARAALRFPTVIYPAPAQGATPQQIGVQKRQAQLQARITAAITVTETQAGWMNRWTSPVIEASICQASIECPPSTLDCSSLVAACQIVITITYPYGVEPIIPALPGFGLLIPSQLQGHARLLIDDQALSTL